MESSSEIPDLDDNEIAAWVHRAGSLRESQHQARRNARPHPVGRWPRLAVPRSSFVPSDQSFVPQIIEVVGGMT